MGSNCKRSLLRSNRISAHTQKGGGGGDRDYKENDNKRNKNYELRSGVENIKETKTKTRKNNKRDKKV